MAPILDPRRLQIDDEHRVVRHDASPRPDLSSEEVCRHKSGSMCTEECAPRLPSLPARRNAFVFHDARNRRTDDTSRASHLAQPTASESLPPAPRAAGVLAPGAVALSRQFYAHESDEPYLVSTAMRENSRVVTVQVFWQVVQTYLSVRSPLCIVTALPRQ